MLAYYKKKNLAVSISTLILAFSSVYHHSYSFSYHYYYYYNNFIELLKLLFFVVSLSDFPVMNRLVLVRHMCKLSFTLREGTGLMRTAWPAAVESSACRIEGCRMEEQDRRKDAWEKRAWGRDTELQGWPGQSLPSCHSHANAERFIRYNNKSVNRPALACVGSFLISLYTWTQL